MRRYSVSVCLLMTAGCPVASPPGDGAPPFNASISGRLTVLPDTGPRLLLEQEVNDELDQTQFLGAIADGDEMTILGDVSAGSGDPTDAFEFTLEGTYEIELRLTFSKSGIEPREDLDLAVYDFARFECAPKDVGDPVFAACFDSTGLNESGSVQVGGPFVVVVSTQQDTAEYQLEVTARLIAEADEPVDLDDAPAKAIFRAEPVSSPSDEVLVQFQGGLGARTIEALLRESGLNLIERSPSGVCRAALSTTADIELAVSRLRALDQVLFAERHRTRELQRVPNDRYFNIQWNYAVINLPEAWDMTVGSDEVIVAVVDSGVVRSHPDLGDRLLDGYDFVSDPASARDGDGRDPDPEDPGDVAGGPGLSSFHGTHVAGTIGAVTNNARGVSGVTWQTRIMPLRAFGRAGRGTAFDSSEAIRYAAALPNASGTLPDEPANIINLSFSASDGRPGSEAERSAIRDAASAGLLIVAAAGNLGTSAETFPAALDEVVAVSAVDIQLQHAEYSNFGSWVELAAPGGFGGSDIDGDGFPDAILSTVARDIRGVVDLRYNYSVGTSMACPHVAGVAALVMAANPDLSASEVREVLTQTALDLGPDGRDNFFGFGLIDAAAAVREARSRRGLIDDSEPELVVVPDTLDFGSTRSELRARVLNAGGGFLQIERVTVVETDGSGWLRATRRGGSAGNVSSDEIQVTVNRDGQTIDILRGIVTVTPETGDPSVVHVVAEVGEAPDFEEIIYVTATGQSEPQLSVMVETSAAQDFAFEFTNLPAGDYIVTAGTDRDQDGDPCGVGDLCGGYPVRISPKAITVGEGESVTDIEFSVSRRLLRTVVTLTGLDE